MNYMDEDIEFDSPPISTDTGKYVETYNGGKRVDKRIIDVINKIKE